MPRPKGYRMSEESKERIGASQRQRWARYRSPRLEAIGRIMNAYEDGDTSLADDLIDDLCTHGHVENMTDQEIEEFRNALLARLRDAGLIIHALSEPRPGAYSLLLQNPSIAERARLEKVRNATHEQGR